MGEDRENIFDSIERTFNHGTNTHDSPQWMRRCFMTGKQCIFCPHETVFEGGDGVQKRDAVFVIMPFGPNLETFYEWSLRPYLQHFNIKTEKIWRADQFANTGYVMCEKICMRIQQAAFVVVDLSVYNPNVYYELGIAVGLNKPILAVCDSSRKEHIEKNCKAVGLRPDKVLYYPNVGYINVSDNHLMKYIQRVQLKPRKTTMRIVGLLLKNEQTKPQDASSINERQDIQVSFPRALEAAVGVAIRMLEHKHSSKHKSLSDIVAFMTDPAVQLAEMLGKMQEQELTELRTCIPSYILDENEQPHSYTEVAQHLDSALITIVDLLSQNALSYFWLGYCHARNINIVPIYREMSSVRPSTDVSNSQHLLRPFKRDLKIKKEALRDEHVLAFDIRALWYMSHKEEEAKKLAEKLAAVFEPILLRDMATQQRRIFWERLTRSGKVLIYNGAVHHRSLNREVVGDWDLRAASELISYLSSTDDSVMPDLKSPFYSPETIADKLMKDPNVQFLEEYEKLIKEQLKGKNCIIVASADVNPITEIILANVYNKKGKLPCFVNAEPAKETSLVIAFKPHVERPTPILPRHFCRVEDTPEERGFYIDGRKIIQPPQSDACESRTLAHLVVARNPFSSENVVVILNGVSGPATYGLAQMLTGAGGLKAHASEGLLKEINNKWASRVESDDYKGVEAIVSVSVSPPGSLKATAVDPSEVLKEQINEELFDKRTVGEWKFLSDKDDNNFSMSIGNPREFPFH